MDQFDTDVCLSRLRDLTLEGTKKMDQNHSQSNTKQWDVAFSNSPMKPVIEQPCIFEVDGPSIFFENDEARIINDNFKAAAEQVELKERQIKEYESVLHTLKERLQAQSVYVLELEEEVQRSHQLNKVLEQNRDADVLQIDKLQQEIRVLCHENDQLVQNNRQQNETVKDLLTTLKQKSKESQENVSQTVKNLKEKLTMRDKQLHESLQNCFELQRRLQRSQDAQASLKSNTDSKQYTPRRR